MFKHIPVYDRKDKDQFFNWLDTLESACAYSKCDCHIAAQAKSTGRLRTAILSIGLQQPWSVVWQVLVQSFSHLISPAHACYYFAKLQQKRGESLKAYIYKYTSYHQMVTGIEHEQNMDPSSWLKFLGSITNAWHTEKILMSNTLPQNLGECMTQAIQYKAAVSKDSHILQVEEEAIEEVKDFKARANAFWGCGEYGHFYQDCKAPNKQQYKSDHAPPLDEWLAGQLKIGMESQQPLTAPMVDQFMQMVLCKKEKN